MYEDASKVMPPISLYWPIMSEVDAHGIAVEVEPSFNLLYFYII